MTQFLILHTARKSGDITDFYVEFLEAQLRVGDEFVTYDTHHKLSWRVINLKAIEDIFVLECSTPHRIGFNNQFAGAVVNTEGSDRLELFRYDHAYDEDLFGKEGARYNKLQRILGQPSD